MYKLHYAKLDLQGDIPCYKFRSEQELADYTENLIYDGNPCVYLLSVGGDSSEVIVTENKEFISEILNKKLNSVYPFYENEDIFLQEYPSYEDAYAVALSMKEVSPLCYSNHEQN